MSVWYSSGSLPWLPIGIIWGTLKTKQNKKLVLKWKPAVLAQAWRSRGRRIRNSRAASALLGLVEQTNQQQ